MAGFVFINAPVATLSENVLQSVKVFVISGGALYALLAKDYMIVINTGVFNVVAMNVSVGCTMTSVSNSVSNWLAY